MRDLEAQVRTATPYDIGDVKERLQEARSFAHWLERMIKHSETNRCYVHMVDRSTICKANAVERARRNFEKHRDTPD